MKFHVSAVSSVLATGCVSFAHGENIDRRNDFRDGDTLTKIRHEVASSFFDDERSARRKRSSKKEQLFDSSSPPNSSSSSSLTKATQTDAHKKLKNRSMPTKLANSVALPEEEGEEAKKCVLTKTNSKSKKNLLDFGALAGKCATDDQVCVDPRLIGAVVSSSKEMEGVGICVNRASIPDAYWNSLDDNNNDPGSSLLIYHFENEKKNVNKGTAASRKRPLNAEEHRRRRLQVDECDIICPGKENRPKIQVSGEEFYYQLRYCLPGYGGEGCNYTINPSTPYPIKCWDTSNVTDMAGAFYTYYNETDDFLMKINYDLYYFDETLQCWDVSKVTNMNAMFYGAAYFNGNIDTWDTSSVTDMQYMFTYAHYFNQPIGNWTVTNVTNMANMFYYSKSYYTYPYPGFNQNLDNWDVQNVLSMTSMFAASIFNGEINSWKPKRCTDMSYMFNDNTVFNQPLNKFGKKLGKVTYMDGMFYGAESFEGKKGFKKWKTGKVQDMTNMFNGAKNFNGGRMDGLKVSKVTSMYAMFYNAASFSKSFKKWKPKKVTDMSSMFEAAAEFGKKNPKISVWDVRSVKYFDHMFLGSSFNSDLNPWNIENMLSAVEMFNDTEFNQCLSTWADKIKAIEFTNTGMFEGSNCPTQTDPIPQEGAWCQGSEQQCFEQTFENTCQNPVAPYNNENDQRCSKSCSDIKKKQAFTGTDKRIKCNHATRCKKQVPFLAEGITFANFCVKKCGTCLNFGK